MAISREEIRGIATKAADKVVERECLNIVDRLGTVLVMLGAAYSMELQGDRPRAKFWLYNAKSDLDKLQRDAPQLKQTVEDIKDGLTKLAESEPGHYSMVHNMLEFEVVYKIAEDFNACQCGKQTTEPSKGESSAQPHQSNPESSITKKGEWTYIKHGVEEIRVKEYEGGLEVQRVLPGPPVSQDDFDAAVEIAREIMGKRS